eukprot:COSAG01_NODE_9645_length_2381_cov_1.943032_2_plen_547_part_00
MLLLSDTSQAHSSAVRFPTEGVQQIALHEVVRCSQRIVEGAEGFQRPDAERTSCAHGVRGPPLRSILFDAEGGSNEPAAYAEHTRQAIRQIVETFPRLSLHDRLAIIVPDEDFRAQLRPLLERELHAAFPGRFELVRTATAAAACVVGGRPAGPGRQQQQQQQQQQREQLVLDDMAQLDGLERLMVVAVGLDSAVGGAAAPQAASALETRSRLYRAITRAHMLVVVVNTFLEGGWFQQLSRLKLEETTPEPAAPSGVGVDSPTVGETAAPGPGLLEGDQRLAEALEHEEQLEQRAEKTLAGLGCEASLEAHAAMRAALVKHSRRLSQTPQDTDGRVQAQLRAMHAAVTAAGLGHDTVVLETLCTQAVAEMDSHTDVQAAAAQLVSEWQQLIAVLAQRSDAEVGSARPLFAKVRKRGAQPLAAAVDAMLIPQPQVEAEPQPQHKSKPEPEPEPEPDAVVGQLIGQAVWDTSANTSQRAAHWAVQRRRREQAEEKCDEGERALAEAAARHDLEMFDRAIASLEEAKQVDHTLPRAESRCVGRCRVVWR